MPAVGWSTGLNRWPAPAGPRPGAGQERSTGSTAARRAVAVPGRAAAGSLKQPVVGAVEAAKSAEPRVMGATVAAGQPMVGAAGQPAAEAAESATGKQAGPAGLRTADLAWPSVAATRSAVLGVRVPAVALGAMPGAVRRTRPGPAGAGRAGTGHEPAGAEPAGAGGAAVASQSAVALATADQAEGGPAADQAEGDRAEADQAEGDRAEADQAGPGAGAGADQVAADVGAGPAWANPAGAVRVAAARDAAVRVGEGPGRVAGSRCCSCPTWTIMRSCS
ncbi:hypothetical protein FHR38_001261 [Micromonospora polyrhachis]|uniref:Uncharacterized protein n=1 Tax=Micromonospora polyrhachis TaxID=1282883 RepID=A0A7W7WNU1_9ACTN|nr:hypothetical protein [Micromonospora polyrhachis]